MPQYRDLNDFLRKHITKDKEQCTHTRIGNGKDILPGKYYIPDEELNDFYKIYYQDVFIKGNQEYLTERQLKNGKGQILIDLDFRYNKQITQRQHNDEHIEDLVLLYIDEINKLLEIPYNTEILVYVFQKDKINNSVKDITKDGIHIVIGIQMDHTLQQILRNNVLKQISNILDDFELENDYESVLDDGITKGHTNWQLYGSCKPGHEAYKLNKIFKCNVDEHSDISIDPIINTQINHLEILSNATARSIKGKSFTILPEIQENYDSIKKNIGKKQTSRKGSNKFTEEGFSFDIFEIKNKDILSELLDHMLNSLSNEQYNIKETHNFLMCLPEKYYNEYNLWIRCGWALHSCDFKLFISWMFFSSQSSKFDYNDIPDYYDKWCSMRNSGLTERSIMYWARESNPNEYKRVRQETIDYYIQLTEKTATEWDIANVLYQLFKDEYRCADLKNNVWYQFKNHRWYEIKKGTTLRFNISKTLSRIYGDKADHYMHLSMEAGENNSELQEKYRKKSAKYAEISSNLKRTNFKQNIMKESAEIFYEADQNFLKYLDENRNFLCFKNGVIDFEKKEFRSGRPEDYLSRCTNINYIPYDSTDETHVESRKEIIDFMQKLFPVEELNKYMWEHLASTLIGTNKNQTFNIYNGCGENGKSKLVELMTLVLGDYKGVVPITLVTRSRGNVGGLSPEIADLKGVRYAVMQEPSKNDRLNDGIMKELTGEDPIQARGLWKEPVTFVPQFKLVVCTNNLFEIKSNDHGTWRRIRLCEFLSKFVNDPCPNEHSPYEFKKDKHIDKFFEKWKTTFMAMLVEIAFKTNGIVQDCNMVMQASNEYRRGQDYLMEFRMDKIETCDDPKGKIKKTEVYTEFKNWYQHTYGKGVPKGKELYDFLDKQLGKYKKGGWCGYKIRYDEDDNDDIEFNDEF